MVGGVYGSIELTIYNDHGDQQFYLKMIDVISNKIILQVYLDEFEKRGRFLNLEETHERVCENYEHVNFQYHDLVCDVVVTKCNFNVLGTKTIFRSIELFRYYERKSCIKY